MDETYNDYPGPDVMCGHLIMIAVPPAPADLAAACQVCLDEGTTLWVPKISSTSRDQVIFVDRATGASLSSYAVLPENDRLWQRFQRGGGVERPVRPVLIVVGLVLVQDPP